jgi:hypothetical protein
VITFDVFLGTRLGRVAPSSISSGAKRKLAEDNDSSSQRTPSKRRRTRHGSDPQSPSVASYPYQIYTSSLESGESHVPKADRYLQQYVSQMLKVGNRRHALGILIVGFDVWFYVYDRGGRICAGSLDLRYDGARMAEAIMRLMMLNPYQLGFEPFLYLSPRWSISKLASISGCVVRVGDRAFRVEDVIHSSGTAFGRGSVVFRAQTMKKHRTRSTSGSGLESEGVDDDIPDQVVVKFAWQLRNRQNEAELLKLAAAKGVKGVVRLYRSGVFTTLSQGLRGKLMSGDMYVDRELRVQILGPVCKPLASLEDIGELKQAFASLVKGAFPDVSDDCNLI